MILPYSLLLLSHCSISAYHINNCQNILLNSMAHRHVWLGFGALYLQIALVHVFNMVCLKWIPFHGLTIMWSLKSAQNSKDCGLWYVDLLRSMVFAKIKDFAQIEGFIGMLKDLLACMVSCKTRIKGISFYRNR